MSLKTQILPAIFLLLLSPHVVKVNSLEDMISPPRGTVTLRSALERAGNGDIIIFDESLDGGTVELSIVGEERTLLKGEVMGMRTEPSGPVSYLEGYFERDYGRSALYARKNVVIDASALPQGVTVKWMGGAADPARVLAVYGDLTLTNVRITGGRSVAEDISTTNQDQPWTLARGGGLAVWGRAMITDTEIYDNHCSGDFDSSRDRGAFGGGLYANIVEVRNSVISGNTVTGGGAAGGGVYSVGGADSHLATSMIERSSISGNSIHGLFTYGGGLYSDGGGIGNSKYLKVSNSTIARNVTGPAPGLPSFLLGMGYWRGGGVYISNGYLTIESSTVVENEVYGHPRTGDLGKSNLAGGIAATIGNAHAVEEMKIGHSIIAGNTITELAGDGSHLVTYAHDVFSGSLLHFKSEGYNQIGKLDFSQILVPVGHPISGSLARKHYPREGDADGVSLGSVLDLVGGITRSDHILSAGVGASEPAVLYYTPQGNGLDRIPLSYPLEDTYMEHVFSGSGTDTFLEIVLGRIESTYGLAGFAESFRNDFEAFLHTVDTDSEAEGLQPYSDPDGTPILTLADTRWFGPPQAWPSNVANYAYIEFWHRLDAALKDENISGMGSELLGDEAWSTLFGPGPLVENNDIAVIVVSHPQQISLSGVDQCGLRRPSGSHGDIGAVELDYR